MNVTSIIDRQMPWSPGAVRAQRTGLVTMGVFTGAWSILGLVSGVLPLQITSCTLVAAALYFFIRSTRAGSTAGTAVAGPQRGRQLSTPTVDVLGWWL